jgi:hypothetical protein
VYVSGPSERKTKLPPPSVDVVTLCDADEIVTAAPATGAWLTESKTRPRTAPVVPAFA